MYAYSKKAEKMFMSFLSSCMYKINALPAMFIHLHITSLLYTHDSEHDICEARHKYLNVQEI